VPGFASPAILFLNSWDQPERAFCHEVFKALPGRGYTRYVEPCAGAFAMPMVAQNAGWLPTQMECSDVSLYTAIVGGLLAGHDLAGLDVRVDGDPVALPGQPLDQAAHLLWVQLLCRTQARPEVDYWKTLIDDLTDNRQTHVDSITGRLALMVERLSGMNYRPQDMWSHMEQVVNDPHTIVNCNPPTYFKGFERFFDTKGRLTWAEPTYAFFDPATGVDRLVHMFDGAPALLLCLQQKPPGQACHPRPVFARDLSLGQYVYLISNRPDEVFAITGGPKVSRHAVPDLTPGNLAILPSNYDVRPDSVVAAVPVKQPVADYYRALWMHRLVGDPGGNNLLVLVDNQVAGVIGYSLASLSKPYTSDSRWSRHAILRFAIGAPHQTLRTTRLATMVALQRSTLELTATPATAMFVQASEGIVTVEYTRHDESKGLRGLMTRIEKRKKPPDGNQLIYAADWQGHDYGQVLTDFVRKEQRWRAERAKAAAS
jgi:hypothetical protein